MILNVQYHFSALGRYILLVMYFEDLKSGLDSFVMDDFGDVHPVDCSVYFGE